MDSKTASTSQPEQMHAGEIQAISQKAFSRVGDDPPSPTYINNVEFAASGMEVIMDAGTVSLESVRTAIEMKSSGKTPAVKFNVDFRFGMSIQTAVVMHRRLTELIQAHAAELAKVSTKTGEQDTPSE